MERRKKTEQREVTRLTLCGAVGWSEASGDTRKKREKNGGRVRGEGKRNKGKRYEEEEEEEGRR